MEWNTKINIPPAYRPFLVILTVHKIRNFRSNDRRILWRNIGRAVGVTILLTIFVCLYLPYELSVCVRQHFNLNVISQPLSFSIGSSQVLIVYLILLLKGEKIIETIDHINQIIKKRKVFRCIRRRIKSIEFIYSIDLQVVKYRQSYWPAILKTKDNMQLSQM